MHIPLGSNGIDLINEDNGRCVLLGDTEQLAHQLRPVTKVLLDQLRAHNAKEGSRSLIRDCLGKKCLACPWWTKEDHPLRWFDSHILIPNIC